MFNLILKVAKEQGFCSVGNKVMIFTSDNEGQVNETVNFKILDIEMS